MKKKLPIVKEWQKHSLGQVYVVVLMNTIHYHFHCEGLIIKRVGYVVLGIDINEKGYLGMCMAENESAKFWLFIMNVQINRSVEDILIAFVDGLNRFPQAIETVYP